MLKKLIIMCLTVVAYITAQAAPEALHIHTRTQGVITILISDLPELDFGEDNTVTVSIPSQPDVPPTVFSFEDIEKCEYGDQNEYDGIQAVRAENLSITISMDAAGVTFGNIPDGQRIEVYTLMGVQVLNAPVHEGTFVLDRSSVPRGVNIVRIGKFTVKISI